MPSETSFSGGIIIEMQPFYEILKDCIMKHFFKRCLLPLLAASISVSCIYDAPGDRFYRTLWEAEEVTLGSLPSDGFMLEFLCGQTVNLTTCRDHRNIYGTYDCNDLKAIFKDLTLGIDDISITFIDAERNGDMLYLRCRVNDSPDSNTIQMHRLSAYP